MPCPLTCPALLRLSTALILWTGLLLQAASAQVDDHATAREQARTLLDRGRTEEALAAYEALTEATPDDPMAWFDLAQAHHISGDYAAAHEVGQRAARFPSIRPTALYNLACASALQGQLDRASLELEQALGAGFVDLDLIEADPDLASLRDAGRVPSPPAQEYRELRHGRVTVPYVVLLPEDHDPRRSYPAAVVFAPGGQGPRSTDLMIETLFADPAARGQRLLVCAVEPDDGWINHPSHHALNALMKQVRREHRVEQDRFQLVGLGPGSRPAAIYAGMSRSYVRGLLLIDGLPFASWDDGDLAQLARHGFPIAIVVGATGHAEASRVQRILAAADGQVSLDLVQGEGALMGRIDARRLLAPLDR